MDIYGIKDEFEIHVLRVKISRVLFKIDILRR